MTHRALQPIAEIIGNVPRRPELAEVEERLVQLRERLDTLCWDDSQAEAIWDEQSPERQRKSAGLRQRIRERRREAQAEIERQICRRAEARAQHVAKLVLKLTPRRRSAVKRIAAAYGQLCAAWAEIDEIDAAIRQAGGVPPPHAKLPEARPFFEMLVQKTIGGPGGGVGAGQKAA